MKNSGNDLRRVRDRALFRGLSLGFLFAVLILVVVFLAGCGFTPEGTALREAAKAGGAQAYDQGLDNAEFFICQAASVGSVRRRYGAPGLNEAYRTLCEKSALDLFPLIGVSDGKSD